MDSFLEEAYLYLVGRIESALKNVDREKVYEFLHLLRESMQDKRVTVDGSGRSLQSALLLTTQLEKSYGIRVNQVQNANLRPLREGDIFVANSNSAKPDSRVVNNINVAKEKGLHTIFITANENIVDQYDIVILLKKDGHNKIYAPLGTEFEQASATLLSCIACSYDKKNPNEQYNSYCKSVINGFKSNLERFQEQEDTINAFLTTIDEYIDINNDKVIYFKGSGINDIISRVIAIRYGHLHKESLRDLKVVYESHWRSRRPDDFAILLSGSGETEQMIKYARQAGDIGMKIFVITCFEDSTLARTTKWYKNHSGTLLIEGRPEKISYFNKSLYHITSQFFPQFELNTYLTLDALLANIAERNRITEEDMKKTHRDKELE
jgi:D-arabinose 5-phosphate isomerase GutQ